MRMSTTRLCLRQAPIALWKLSCDLWNRGLHR
ncbi:hypothetical protein RSAG8_08786, partial [Rhizoctonia solani AG-8 WAC10335]